MTYGFALMTAGTLLLYSGWSNSSILEVLQGIAKPKSGPGEAGFVALLLSGSKSAVTPESGGEGMHTAHGTPKGLTTFDGKPVCKWIAVELQWAREHGWTGSLNSGYRSAADQARVCAETSNPCAPPGTSNHQGKKYPKGAADVTNEAELNKVLAKKPGRKLYWTGKAIGDNPHFSSGLSGV